jgi:ubiquinone biosynthesis monooxygenase Coq7
MAERHYSPFDKVLIGFDQALRTVFGKPLGTERPDPGREEPESDLSEEERDLAGRLMRINHTGEVCAQALYQGQALTAKLPSVRSRMERAAAEENDHLLWCERRIHELGGRTSLLNPLWYAGSFAIGAAAGLAGDKWSLGFVAETEHQVGAHLDSHLTRLSADDHKSRAVLDQMKEDELQHARTAEDAGGVRLPAPIRYAMQLTSRVMTRTVYWL